MNRPTTPRLFADRPLGDAIREAESILETAVSGWNPFPIFGCLSGGHDSLPACELASQHPRFGGCVHINTLTGIPETSEFVRQVCKERGWRLYEYTPPQGHRYEEIVLKHGFPGPGQHLKIYARLKERALRIFLREVKQHPSDRIGLVTGVRKSESTVRMGRVEAVQKDKGHAWVWIAPLLTWSKAECAAYMERYRLPRNPVVEALGMSGECLCGAFASPGELQRIAAHYPEVADRITDLEAECQKRGLPCVWDGKPPAGPRVFAPEQLSLCSGCEWGGAAVTQLPLPLSGAALLAGTEQSG